MLIQRELVLATFYTITLSPLVGTLTQTWCPFDDNLEMKLKNFCPKMYGPLYLNCNWRVSNTIASYIIESPPPIFILTPANGKFVNYKAKLEHGAPFKSEQNVYFRINLNKLRSLITFQAINQTENKLTWSCRFPHSVHSSQWCLLGRYWNGMTPSSKKYKTKQNKKWEKCTSNQSYSILV